MLRLAQLTITLALLTGLAYAANKVTLSCVASNSFSPKDIRDMSLIIDMDRRTVTTIYGVFSIGKVTDNLVWFDDGSPSISGWSGNIDRISGIGHIWDGGAFQYDFTCKPGRPLF